ncbi:MAG: alpha/beta hydrolase [Deltaproteobacteria bacterium]|nr:alpha/beta hydrolase [Deltaproteobacteria bacterium]
MIRFCLLAFSTALLAFSACSSPPVRGLQSTATPIDPKASYLFYLHGRIVEIQGPEAVSPEFGPYEYRDILDELGRTGLTVVSELRGEKTDIDDYAERIVEQMRLLVEGGVPAERITVVGASKGAIIAMVISTRAEMNQARFVLMGGCSAPALDSRSLDLHGAVLSIFEASDGIAQSCSSLFARSPHLGDHREIRLDTGLGHGFLYRPLPEWTGPALEWAASP